MKKCPACGGDMPPVTLKWEGPIYRIYFENRELGWASLGRVDPIDRTGYERHYIAFYENVREFLTIPWYQLFKEIKALLPTKRVTFFLVGAMCDEGNYNIPYYLPNTNDFNKG